MPGNIDASVRLRRKTDRKFAGTAAKIEKLPLPAIMPGIKFPSNHVFFGIEPVFDNAPQKAPESRMGGEFVEKCLEHNVSVTVEHSHPAHDLRQVEGREANRIVWTYILAGMFIESQLQLISA
jgi:hypothetical protein